MAKNLKDPEERMRRVILVGQIFGETGMSTRQLARHISETYFPISNCTVSDYLTRYVKMRPYEVENIRKKIYENTSDSIDKPEIRKRVEMNATLFEQGFTIEEIAENTDTNMWSVYRDITVRLPKMDEERFKNIKTELENNSHRTKNQK